MTFSVIIPTKNRYEDLLKALDSIVEQQLLPDELILIDQSTIPVPDTVINTYKSKLPDTEVKYCHDTSVKGLVHAKSVGAGRSSKQIVCFLEDDIVLEKAYFHELIGEFIKNPAMVGSSGVITNPPYASRLYGIIHKIFHRGIFYDPRPTLYNTVANWKKDVVASCILSGGLSAWRSEVFDYVQFDLERQFHMLEDFEFSYRVHGHFGDALFINRCARLAHYFASSGRNNEFVKNKRKAIEYKMFYKKHAEKQYARLSYIWLMVGLFATSCLRAANTRDTAPVRGLYSGMIAEVK